MRITDAADSEFAVIGCILRGGAFTAAEVGKLLTADDFRLTPRLSTAYRVVGQLTGRGTVVPAEVLRTALHEAYTDEWREVMSPVEAYQRAAEDVRRFYGDVTAASGATWHAERVAAASQMIQARHALGELFTQSEEWDGSPGEFVAEAQRRMLTLSLSVREAKPTAIADLMDAHWEQFEAEYAGNAREQTVLSGFARMDRMTGGWGAGDFVVVAGKSGHGKSVLATMFAAAAAKRGVPVAFYSLEMTQTELLRRLTFAEARVDSRRYRTRSLSAEEWAKLRDARDRIRRYPIRLMDDATLTMAQIASQCRHLHFQRQCGLVVVDYTQLVTPDRESRRAADGNRQQEVDDIARSMKRLATELSVPVIGLSQLNDQGLVRESRGVKNHADVLLKVERQEEIADVPEAHECGLRYHLVIDKCRDGEEGVVHARFFPSMTRFDEEAATDEHLGPW